MFSCKKRSSRALRQLTLASVVVVEYQKWLIFAWIAPSVICKCWNNASPPYNMRSLPFPTSRQISKCKMAEVMLVCSGLVSKDKSGSQIYLSSADVVVEFQKWLPFAGRTPLLKWCFYTPCSSVQREKRPFQPASHIQQLNWLKWCWFALEPHDKSFKKCRQFRQFGQHFWKETCFEIVFLSLLTSKAFKRRNL